MCLFEDFMRYYYVHFTFEEAESHKGYIYGPNSHIY